MQSRNPTSSGSRNVMNIEDVDSPHHQEDNTTAQDASMHPHPYLNYPSHSQMMGMSQMAPPHGIENHFQVISDNLILIRLRKST